MKLNSIAKSLVVAGALSLTGLALATNAIADGGPRRGSIKDAPYVAPFSWTGFYVGAHVGAGWTKQNATSADPASDLASGTLDDRGALGGIHAGYNYQLGSNLVIGAEVDWSKTNLNGTASDVNRFPGGAPVGAGGISFSSGTDWLASVRARLGFLASPNLMIYATGGAAWASVDYRTLDIHGAGPAFPASFSVSDTRNGYVLGGGLEYAMSRNWMLRAEYLHYRIDGAGATGVPRVGFPAELSTFAHSDLKIDTARVGISYKF